MLLETDGNVVKFRSWPSNSGCGARRLLSWLPSMVSVADLVFSIGRAVGSEMYKFYMDWSWYIVNIYVPMLIASQIMIVYHWMTRRNTPRVI
jgi:beta-glucosidase-like glycosyl hydrolase